MWCDWLGKAKLTNKKYRVAQYPQMWYFYGGIQAAAIQFHAEQQMNRCANNYEPTRRNEASFLALHLLMKNSSKRTLKSQKTFLQSNQSSSLHGVEFHVCWSKPNCSAGWNRQGTIEPNIMYNMLIYIYLWYMIVGRCIHFEKMKANRHHHPRLENKQ